MVALGVPIMDTSLFFGGFFGLHDSLDFFSLTSLPSNTILKVHLKVFFEEVVTGALMISVIDLALS